MAQFDNSNVNYAANDGFSGSLSERSTIIQGQNIKFDPLHPETFFRSCKSSLQCLNNMDRIADGIELEPVQGAGESAARLAVRLLQWSQRKRLARDIIEQPIRLHMIETNDPSFLKAIEHMDHPQIMLENYENYSFLPAQ